MKKFISLLLCFIICLTSLFVNQTFAFAENEDYFKTLGYDGTFENGTVSGWAAYESGGYWADYYTVSWFNYSRTADFSYEGRYSLSINSRHRDAIFPISGLKYNTFYSLEMYVYLPEEAVNGAIETIAILGKNDYLYNNCDKVYAEACDVEVGSWQKVQVPFYTDKNSDFNIDIRYLSDSVTKLYIDNITLKAGNYELLPEKPELESSSPTGITLKSVAGCEYSLDKISWQKSNVFDNLLPGTKYTFYQRFEASATKPAGSPSSGATFSTTKYPTPTPTAPTIKVLTATSAEIEEAESCYDYMLFSDDGKSKVQASPIFTGLIPGMSYKVRRIKYATATNYASDFSPYTSFTTPKLTAASPDAPTLKTTTFDMVELEGADGYEYSIDGVNWQSSPLFTELTVNTKYSFYQRTAETSDTYASESSKALEVTTAKCAVAQPSLPVIGGLSLNTITLMPMEGYEYSLDGINWQSHNTFRKLTPFTVYSVYQRIAETDTTYASVTSAPSMVKTGGEIQLKYFLGDINYDFSVNLEDLVVLAQCVAGWNVACNFITLDTNGSGNVDLSDVVLLAQRLAEWDVTIH
ncbi:MAG: carbohydrate binding domain-containing protein [Clostridia bacterium]|nr:carbohydrate binding domain-containing protein [Clostridia bacterium]